MKRIIHELFVGFVSRVVYCRKRKKFFFQIRFHDIVTQLHAGASREKSMLRMKSGYHHILRTSETAEWQ